MKSKNNSVALSKKLIAEKSKSFDKQYMKAGNAFERVKCLRDIRDFINLELDEWILQLSDYEQLSPKKQAELIPEAKQRISELNELVDQLNELAAPDLEASLLIQNAMIREGKLKEPVII
jgi:hypothetical protein